MLGQIYYVTFLARIGNLKRRQTVSATRNGLAKGEEIREKADAIIDDVIAALTKS